MTAPQSVDIQRVFWEMVPKDELVEDISFNHRTGFRGHRPVVEFKNGSLVVFYTAGAGAEALAGSEYHYIHIDEPVDQRLYEEAVARVRNTGGTVGISLTPINGPPLPWLERLCKEGIVTDHHYPLTLENLTSPITGRVRLKKDGKPWDAAFVEELRKTTNPIEAPVILDGHWEGRVEGHFFKCFNRQKHLNGTVRLDPAQGRIHHAIGIDYAAADREYGQTAILVNVQPGKDDAGRPTETVYILDEVVLPGVSTNAEFGRHILNMLARNSIQWRELSYIHGDNPVTSKFVEKSNIQTMRAITREQRIPYDALQPRILNAKEGPASAGSHDTGCRYLYEGLAAGRILIHPRCARLADAFEKWDYSRQSPYKDIIDAARYSLKPWIFPRGGRYGGTVRFG